MKKALFGKASKWEIILYFLVSGLVGVYFYQASGSGLLYAENLCWSIISFIECIVLGIVFCYLPYRVITLKKCKWWELPLILAIFIALFCWVWHINVTKDNALWSLTFIIHAVFCVTSFMYAAIRIMIDYK